eukprot:2843504-Amphidinium_carterae.1
MSECVAIAQAAQATTIATELATKVQGEGGLSYVAEALQAVTTKLVQIRNASAHRRYEEFLRAEVVAAADVVLRELEYA